MLEVLFVTPNNSNGIYQELSNKYSAIETPTWSLLLAQSCRTQNYKVGILDCLAENLSDETAYLRIKKLNPRLLCFVVYGQNVNAGTTNMSGATRLAKFLKNKYKSFKISFIGSHVQALPVETLKNENDIDFVFSNEGIYALCKNYNFSDSRIKIIGLRQSEKIHEEILTKEELYNLKIYKDIYVIDHMNLHKLAKVKKMMSFFSSEQAKVLALDEIVTYLKKFNLFTIRN